VQVDPRRLSERELEHLTRRYAYDIANLLGPEKDIPAPDVNTDGRIMAWLMDTISVLNGQLTPGVVTGKPLALGGSLGHLGATSAGLAWCVEATFARLGLELVGARVVVQGLGKVGGPLVHLLAQRGMSIVGVADVSGAMVDPTGMNAAALADHLARHGTLAGFPAEPCAPAELFAVPCELVVPAALDGVITVEVAEQMATRVIVEAANGPTVPEADPVLDERKIVVVPDVLANAGGVVASSFEWAQSRQGLAWGRDLVERRLRETMERAFDAVWQESVALNVSLRRAAVALGLARVAEAARYRGLWP
jgi:glutamate dehydrogenase (NAD(P)+)